MQDWISSSLEFTEGSTSPEAFRLWSSIATLAGTLERKVWVETQRSPVYPNFYILLVAPPGIGKSVAIDYVLDYWLQLPGLKISPDSVTKAALVDVLDESKRRVMIDPLNIMEFNSLQIAASEFGVLVPAHDLEFLNTLNHIYDNPKFYRERRRHAKGDPIQIIKPQLNIIAGTQPAYLSNILPEEAWGMGFMSRIIMIYSRESIYAPMFRAQTRDKKLFDDLTFDLRSIHKLIGKVTWSLDAMSNMEKWIKGGMNPMTDHGKLESYAQRRPLHLLKLSMISSVSRSNEMVIRNEDLERAKTWLFAAEKTMPDVFKDMVYRSDGQIVEELHWFAWKLWAIDQKPIHEARLIHFLRTKLPSDRIDRVLDLADRANMVVRVAGTKTWIPRPKTDHGVGY